MKKIIVLLFYLIVVSVSAQDKYQEVLDSIYNANQDAKGIMVHLESPSMHISWSGASGYSDFNKKLALEADQPALIASNIKTYVSATILRLVEMNKIELNQSIKSLLTEKTVELFSNDGYDLDSIKVVHLLSHTSGISCYWDDAYIEFVNKNPKYRWTRNEQLELAVTVGNPLRKPEETFEYADVNYLFLTEIIEVATEKPFYKAMRELLRFKELDLNNTWFPTLEETPKGVKPLVHQYYEKYNWDSYDLDPSWDLYGGGGIACNTRDLAYFSYNLFNSNIVKDTTILNLIFTKVSTQDTTQNNYRLGLNEFEYSGIKGFGHGGFWGTVVVYFPKLNTTIAVFVLEKGKSSLTSSVIKQMVDVILLNQTR